MVGILHFHCRQHQFDPWLGNKDLAMQFSQNKNFFFFFKEREIAENSI